LNTASVRWDGMEGGGGGGGAVMCKAEATEQYTILLVMGVEGGRIEDCSFHSCVPYQVIILTPPTISRRTQGHTPSG
jgi:hypothetical protein